MQRRNADDVSIRKIDVKTNAVFQLTHIARPVVRCKIAERFWRERKFPAPGRGGKHAREMPGEQDHVIPPLPQSRNAKRKTIEPPEEILAESPLPDEFRQIPVGGGNDAHIHPVRTGRSYFAEFSALQKAQQIGLHIQRQLPHLVKKNRAPVGQLELAYLAPQTCSRERPFLIAEQFALDQPLRAKPRS